MEINYINEFLEFYKIMYKTKKEYILLVEEDMERYLDIILMLTMFYGTDILIVVLNMQRLISKR